MSGLKSQMSAGQNITLNFKVVPFFFPVNSALTLNLNFMEEETDMHEIECSSCNCCESVKDNHN